MADSTYQNEVSEAEALLKRSEALEAQFMPVQTKPEAGTAQDANNPANFYRPVDAAPDIQKTQGTADSVYSGERYGNQFQDLNSRNRGYQEYIAQQNPENLMRGATGNIAKNDPRGNINNRNYETTMRYSRMIDALNNRLYMRPGQTGYNTAYFGVNSGTNNTPGTYNQLETEETRAMQNARQQAAKAQGHLIDNQATITNENTRVQQAVNDAAVQLNNLYATTGVQLDRAAQQQVYQNEYSKLYDMHYQERLKEWTDRLVYSLKGRIADYAQRLLDGGQAELAQLYTNMAVGGVAVTDINYLLQKVNSAAIMEILSDPSLTTEERYQRLNALFISNGISGVKSMGAGITSVFKGDGYPAGGVD